MKLKFKLPRLSFRTITSGVFLIVLLAELLITVNYLYNNLKAEPPVVNTEAILKADLKGYSQVYIDITERRSYAAQEFTYTNSNPFKFGQ